jgi:beta-aspartyl-dipeptidase (metallo-type)
VPQPRSSLSSTREPCLTHTDGDSITVNTSNGLRITLLEHGEVYAPQYRGQQSVLLVNGTIARVGAIDPEPIRALDAEVRMLDARGCVVLPGLIDPHVHLIGGGGEAGWSTRTPETRIEDVVRAGATTVVGCLGTDATTRHLTTLLAKVRALEEQGISAWMYTGAYQVPPPTITGSVRGDLIIVDRVLGLGEIAIADQRSSQPSVAELARLVAEASTGGALSGKAGVTHFHLGSGAARLTQLHALIDEYDIAPRSVYATHINRSDAAMDDAIALASKGAFVDIDTADQDLFRWLPYYYEHGGDPRQLTISSDGNGSLPQYSDDGELTGVELTTLRMRFEQFVCSIAEHGWTVEQILPHFTSNVARALRLRSKGAIQEGLDADVLVLRRDTLEQVHLLARGEPLMLDGDVVAKDPFG